MKHQALFSRKNKEKVFMNVACCSRDWHCKGQLRSGHQICLGWSGGRIRVLGKLSVTGRPTNLDNSRARAYCACSRCGWGMFWTFFSRLFFSLLSPSLWEMARYRLK